MKTQTWLDDSQSAFSGRLDKVTGRFGNLKEKVESQLGPYQIYIIQIYMNRGAIGIVQFKAP